MRYRIAQNINGSEHTSLPTEQPGERAVLFQYLFIDLPWDARTCCIPTKQPRRHAGVGYVCGNAASFMSNREENTGMKTFKKGGNSGEPEDGIQSQHWHRSISIIQICSITLPPCDLDAIRYRANDGMNASVPYNSPSDQKKIKRSSSPWLSIRGQI